MHRGAGRGPYTRANLDAYPGSKCTASLGDRAAGGDLHAYADPGAYPDLGAGRDFYACTDPGTYPDHSAGGLLARR